MDIVSRVKNILTTPKTEWYEIDAEESSIGSVYTSYVIPLAAIPVVASIIGGLLTQIMNNAFTVTGFIGLLVIALVQYVLGLGVVYLMALIVDKLAPTFEASPHMPSAFKLIAYSYTAAWLAGALAILPFGLIAILIFVISLYTYYLIYTGLPVLMRAPQERALVYTIAIVVVAIVLVLVVSLIIALVIAPFFIATRV